MLSYTPSIRTALMEIERADRSVGASSFNRARSFNNDDTKSSVTNDWTKLTIAISNFFRSAYDDLSFTSDESHYEDEEEEKVEADFPNSVHNKEHIIRPRNETNSSYDDSVYEFNEYPFDKVDLIKEEKVDAEHEQVEKRPSMAQVIVEDFNPKQGDFKILRAVGRTATVNIAIVITTATHGAAGVVGFITGGAITLRRLTDGIQDEDDREVTKSLLVFCAATGASLAGQAATGAILIGLAGASLPVAGAIAFGVGCASGITAGALSEFTVDSVMDKFTDSKILRVRRNKSVEH